MSFLSLLKFFSVSQDIRNFFSEIRKFPREILELFLKSSIS